MSKQRIFLFFFFLAAGIPCNVGAQVKPAWNPDSVITLPAVEIRGSRIFRINGGEIRALEVEKNPAVATGTASEAFRQLPSLTTDIEGALSFRGSNRTAVLVNGVPYGLLEENSGDVLIQLPALFFHSLLLNTAPGAEYMPDGSSALLSLSSLPAPGSSPLQVTLGGGWHERYDAGAAWHVEPGRFRIAARYNYRKEFRDRTFKKSTADAAGTTRMDNRASGRPDVHTADLSVSYRLTERDRLSVYGFYYRMDYSRYGAIHNTKLNAAGAITNRMLRHRYNDQLQDAYAAEARWRHTFAFADGRSTGSGLEILFNYNNFRYDEDNRFENENPADGKIVKQDNQFIDQEKRQYFLSAAYYKMFDGGWLLKGGYRGRLLDDRYTALAEDLKAGDWVPNAAKSNDFTANRTINQLYASLHKQAGRFHLEGGLQGEWSRQEAKNKEAGRLADDTGFHVYPQAKLVYHDHAGGSWQLVYTERTDRPLLSELNPFTDRSDATYVKQGNPQLKPEYVHLGELSYTYGQSNWRVVPAAYFRYRTNRIMDIAVPAGADVIWRKENVGDTQTAGLELSAYWCPVARLSAGLSGNVWWDQIDGRTLGFDEDKAMSCWDVKGHLNIAVSPHTDLQIDGFYISDQLTAQGKIGSRYAVNAGVAHYLMDRKLILRLSVNNIFDSLKETTVIDTKKLQVRQERNRDARVAWLTLTYRL